MKFIINNDEWEIIEKPKQELVDIYNSENEEKSSFVLGVTVYSKHEIWINENMHKEQKIKTLMHELTHCYIWEHGLYEVLDFNHEMACDLVSSSNAFINKVIKEYKKENLIKLDNIDKIAAEGEKIIKEYNNITEIGQ